MAECVVVQCSGGAYWEGGSEGAGSVYTLGRFPEAGLRQYSLAGGKLAYVNTFKNRVGNFTSRAGEHMFLLSRTQELESHLSHMQQTGKGSDSVSLHASDAAISCPRNMCWHG